MLRARIGFALEGRIDSSTTRLALALALVLALALALALALVLVLAAIPRARPAGDTLRANETLGRGEPRYAVR